MQQCSQDYHELPLEDITDDDVASMEVTTKLKEQLLASIKMRTVDLHLEDLLKVSVIDADGYIVIASKLKSESR